MRARILFSSDMSEQHIVAELRDALWWPPYDQSSENAATVKLRVSTTVASEHQKTFEDGFRFVIQSDSYRSEGSVGYEGDKWVIRILNDSISYLQLSCDQLAQALVEFAARNNKKLIFERIEIMEASRKEVIIQGEVVATKADKRKVARKHKHVEFTVARFGIILFCVLLALTFPYPFTITLGHVWDYTMDILRKIGTSVLVTASVSYLSYYSYRVSFARPIVWSILGERRFTDLNIAV